MIRCARNNTNRQSSRGVDILLSNEDSRKFNQGGGRTLVTIVVSNRIKNSDSAITNHLKTNHVVRSAFPPLPSCGMAIFTTEILFAAFPRREKTPSFSQSSLAREGSIFYLASPPREVERRTYSGESSKVRNTYCSPYTPREREISYN